ncbi:MAG: ammonia-forming cytochrome c nitrite reductase subunit c552 [Selenomonas sp.]|nr:ammonia-forming cytochrome c nitrite reductase subunit c552 [Selenomonas sp.]MCI7330754.1 ammonia-forming cytochrome c nitrite reductase subunit c552 [Selenomonadaceae bacterium]MDD7056302.1 ammonia-forming cytochrome c nitrite reductase subunit c552 [Selenomonadaceae bacterium]MDY3916746.1 ammonia-forming cytochrome c nitrite reductase subunit c552 [Selenomonadaceae bacterium]
MSKLQKIIAGIAAVCFVFFGFVVFRIAAAPNDNSVKLAKIPEDKKLTTDAYKDAYPLEYESYMKNNMGGKSPTGYGGSDPGVSYLEMQPEMLENFKGYKFALQYDVARGHTHAGEDFLNTKRLPGQKGSCITCKGSYMYDVYFKQSGWDYASKPINDVIAPIKDDEWFGCSSCHDPETMELRVYQQGFVDAMARRGVDVNNAPHNDKRAYVCAQCHNEYYFKAEDGRVDHPWDNGLEPEDEFQFYQSGQAGAFKGDWKQPDSQTMMLKAQHPDFEIWATSVHAENGVTCVDCHMPYMRKDGQKYTSHWMTSPLKTVQESCLKCHDESAQTLINRVKTIHDNNYKLQRLAGQAVSEAHLAIKAAMDAGVPTEQLDGARLKLREASFYWDWIAAENGNGFHNPDKCMRVSGEAIDLAHKAKAEADALH